MFFIAGIQPKTVKLDSQPRQCPSCRNFDTFMKRMDHYLSIFFIPILRVKKGASFLGCRHCGTMSDESGNSWSESYPSHSSQCPGCGGELKPSFSFCPNCGKKI